MKSKKAAAGILALLISSGLLLFLIKVGVFGGLFLALKDNIIFWFVGFIVLIMFLKR